MRLVGLGPPAVLSLLPERLDRLLLVGAHTVDIAAGAGGALLELCRAHPGVAVQALVVTGGGSLREQEERSALAAFCPGVHPEVSVLDLPDGRLPPARWERAKMALEELRTRGDPDLILAPSPRGAAPEHHTLAALVTAVFRDHLVLGYEILTGGGDLGRPLAHLPLSEPVIREKIAKLHEHYGSQRDRTWFDAEVFGGLARLRGLQCHARYAEAFDVTAVVLGVAPLTDLDPE